MNASQQPTAVGRAVPGAVAEELRRLELSANWPHEVILELQKIARAIDVPADTILFREGDAAAGMHLIADGQVVLSMHVPARGSVRLMTVGRGELLGWSGVVGGSVTTATATALKPTRLISFSAAELAELCQRNHEVGFQVMQRVAWALARRLTATRLQLLDLYSHEPPQISSPPGAAS